MPQKKSHRLKDRKVLEQMAKHNPDTENKSIKTIFKMHTILRDQGLEDVCLYDLVAHYSWQSRDDDGNEVYQAKKSLTFLITNCLILKRRIRGTTTSTH